MVNLDRVLAGAREEGVSDILFSPGLPPAYKLGDEYVFLDEPVLELPDIYEIAGRVGPDLERFIRGVLEGGQEPQDRMASMSGVLTRFRVHLSWAMPDPFLQAISLGDSQAVPFLNFRLIPLLPKSFAELGFPQVLGSLLHRRVGLFLVVGPSDSGKTTTLAAMTEYINANYARHVVTVENPIEYLYERKRAIIHQREVGRHVPDMVSAVYNALRQNVAVLVLGEVRTSEEVAAMIEALETGHLVLASMHATGVVDALERLFRAVPQGHRELAVQVVGTSLLGVIAQRLVPLASRKAGESFRRVLAYELLVLTDSHRKRVLEGRWHELYEALLEGGMAGYNCTLEHSLARLVGEGRITPTVARMYANREEVLIDLLRSAG